jgi:ATP-dependent Clp protease ATP-binding subunit ClpC
VFERFTEGARKATSLGRQEALRLDSEFIGDEHLLAGLLKEGRGLGSRVLLEAGVVLEDFWRAVGSVGPEPRTGPTLGQLPFTQRARRAIELAGEATSSLGNDGIGTEHLLLGLLKDPDCVASRALLHLGLKPETLRDAVLQGIAAGEGDPHPPPPIPPR